MENITYICSKCKRLSIKELKECWYCGEEIIAVQPPEKQEPHIILVKLKKPIFYIELSLYFVACLFCVLVIIGYIFSELLYSIYFIFIPIIFAFFGVVAVFVALHSYKLYKKTGESIIFGLLHDLTKLRDE